MLYKNISTADLNNDGFKEIIVGGSSLHIFIMMGHILMG